MGSLTSVRTELEAILTALMAANKLQTVFSVQPVNVGATPAAVLELDAGNQERFVDTLYNELPLNYTIRIMVEKPKSEATDSIQVAKLEAITDNVIDELRQIANINLNGESHSVLNSGISRVLQGQTGDLTVFFQEIKVEVKALKTTRPVV
jgi:hypothetical protein